MKFLLLIGILWILSGCVSKTVQTDALLTSNPNIKNYTRIANVPFINQQAHECGPATLTMAMNWAGKMVTVDQIIDQVYTPEMKGTLQSDLVSASRRNGLMAIPIQGLSTLLAEINDGHPVVVFENLALSWLPQWHYAVVFGYDLSKEVVIMHSGPEAYKNWDMRKFERSWMLADYWGLVVLPAGQISKNSTEFANAVAAAGLEQAGQYQAAEKSYVAILKKWPDSLTAAVGIANIAFKNNEFKKAVRYLRQAANYHPQSSIVSHNLAVAESKANF